MFFAVTWITACSNFKVISREFSGLIQMRLWACKRMSIPCCKSSFVFRNLGTPNLRCGCATEDKQPPLPSNDLDRMAKAGNSLMLRVLHMAKIRDGCCFLVPITGVVMYRECIMMEAPGFRFFLVKVCTLNPKP